MIAAIVNRRGNGTTVGYLAIILIVIILMAVLFWTVYRSGTDVVTGLSRPGPEAVCLIKAKMLSATREKFSMMSLKPMGTRYKSVWDVYKDPRTWLTFGIYGAKAGAEKSAAKVYNELMVGGVEDIRNMGLKTVEEILYLGPGCGKIIRLNSTDDVVAKRLADEIDYCMRLGMDNPTDYMTCVHSFIVVANNGSVDECMMDMYLRNMPLFIQSRSGGDTGNDVTTVGCSGDIADPTDNVVWNIGNPDNYYKLEMGIKYVFEIYYMPRFYGTGEGAVVLTQMGMPEADPSSRCVDEKGVHYCGEKWCSSTGNVGQSAYIGWELKTCVCDTSGRASIHVISCSDLVTVSGIGSSNTRRHCKCFEAARLAQHPNCGPPALQPTDETGCYYFPTYGFSEVESGDAGPTGPAWPEQCLYNCTEP